MKRALLLFNPEATAVSRRVRDVIARALGTELELDVAETKRRHHATHLAAGAAHEGFGLVIVLAGDGTLNEVINGLVGSEVPVVPLPGGSTNVFARTLGLPNDPIEATAVVIERIQEGAEPRRIDLGSVNGRAFAFCAGVGFDAAVVRAVERRFRMKQRIGQAFFVYQALRTFFFAFRKSGASMTLTVGGEQFEVTSETIVCNSDPFTFWGERPLRVCPNASVELGLDVTSFTRFRSPTVLRALGHAFRSGKHLKMRKVRAFHDLDGLRVECARALPYQVDGDYAGENKTFVFESLPRALSVLT